MRSVKHAQGLHLPVIYQNLCECKLDCIGQTGWTIAEHCKQHPRCISLNYPAKSTVSQHSILTGHEVCFFQLPECCPNQKDLKIVSLLKSLKWSLIQKPMHIGVNLILKGWSLQRQGKVESIAAMSLNDPFSSRSRETRGSSFL